MPMGKMKLSRSIIMAIVAIISIGIGYVGGITVTQPTISSQELELTESKAEILHLQGEISNSDQKHEAQTQQLRDNLANMKAELLILTSQRNSLLDEVDETKEDLNGRIVALQDNLDNRIGELSTYQDRIVSSEIAKDRMLQKMKRIEVVMEKLESDKKLLTALRDDMPIKREEERSYWQSLRNLSFQSDPSLVVNVDKILANLDVHYDWVEVQPPIIFQGEEVTTAQDLILWLLDRPPDYSNAVDEYQKELFLVMINHIREASDVLAST